MEFWDRTTNERNQIPSLPETFSLKQPQAFEATPILGGYPHVQIGAQGVREWSASIDLWGDAGEAFYYLIILPSFGRGDGRPHKVTVTWGKSARDSFTGYPIGMPEVEHELGGRIENGIIFARLLTYTLIEINNQQPRVIVPASGSTGAAKTIVITVQQGDTLQKIAARYKTTIDKIVALNKPKPAFSPPNGSKLIVPKP